MGATGNRCKIFTMARRQRRIGAKFSLIGNRRCVDFVNTEVIQRGQSVELVRARHGFLRRFRFKVRAPVDLLVPVAETASDFLCHADFSLVRKCDSLACIQHFYDLSENHGRRWCSMSVCGIG